MGAYDGRAFNSRVIPFIVNCVQIIADQLRKIKTRTVFFPYILFPHQVSRNIQKICKILDIHQGISQNIKHLFGWVKRCWPVERSKAPYQFACVSIAFIHCSARADKVDGVHHISIVYKLGISGIPARIKLQGLLPEHFQLGIGAYRWWHIGL